MAPHPPAAGDWAARTLRTTAGLAAWTAAWVGSLALARFGPDLLWNNETAPTLITIAFTVVIGAGMLLAHRRFLQSLDELQRTIQLQAMAWSLGAGLVGGLAWTLFTRLDLVGFEAEIAHLVGFMSVVYIAAIVIGSLRYR
jgi:hypothetical protein